MDIMEQAEAITSEKGIEAGAQFLADNENGAPAPVEDTTPSVEEVTDTPEVETLVEEVTEDSTDTTPDAESSTEDQVDKMNDDELDALADKLDAQGGNVPSWLVKKLRAKNRDAKKENEEKGNKLDETLGNLTNVLQNLQQPAAPQPTNPQPPAPDGHWNKTEFSDALYAEPEKAGQMVDSHIGSLEGKLQETQQQMQLMQYQMGMTQLEGNARQRNSSYDEMKNKYIEIQANTLKAVAPTATPQQLKQEAERQFNSNAYSFMQQGSDPTAVLESHMQQIGFAAKPAAPQAKAGINIDAIAAGISKHQTLSGKTGAPAKTISDVTIDDLGGMSQDKIMKFGTQYAAQLNKGKKDYQQVDWAKAIEVFVESQMKGLR